MKQAVRYEPTRDSFRMGHYSIFFCAVQYRTTWDFDGGKISHTMTLLVLRVLPPELLLAGMGDRARQRRLRGNPRRSISNKGLNQVTTLFPLETLPSRVATQANMCSEFQPSPQPAGRIPAELNTYEGWLGIKRQIIERQSKAVCILGTIL